MKEFWGHLDDAQKKQDLLETILGKTFRSRHPDAQQEIDAAFAQYGKDTFKVFPFTFNCLTVRLAYVLAPIVRIRTPTDSEPRMILKPKRRDQDNNWADEHYVLSALVCDRLLTMDKGMRNIANLFQANRRWKGQTIFFVPAEEQDLPSQITTLLV